jgi:O-antigen/teichoic acid export membrane protein
MSNPIKKLLGQTAVYGLPSIIGRMLNFLLVPLYIQKFNHPSDYGVVSQLYAWVAFLVVFLSFGMETAFFRFFQNKDEKQAVFANSFLTVLGVNSFFFLLVVFFNQNIADTLNVSNNPEFILFLGAIVCIDATSALPLAKLRAEERAKKFALIQTVSIVVNISLNLILMCFVFDKDHPAQGVTFILLANLFSSLVKPAFLYKDFIATKFKFNPVLAKEMFVYALPIMIGGLAGIVNETIDRILLVNILYDGKSEASLTAANASVGVYSACYKLSMIVTILIQAYRYAAEPFFFAQLKNEEKNKIYSKVMNYFVAAICLVFLLVSLNLDSIKVFFIPNKNYWVGLKVVPILLLANVFLGVYFNQSIWYKLSNQTRFGAYIAIVGALFTIAINLAFIPTYGYMASAWATLIVYGFQMIASYYLGQKFYPIRYNLRKFFLYLGLAIALFFLAQSIPFEDGSIVKIIFSNFLVAFYILVIWFIEKPMKGELQNG